MRRSRNAPDPTHLLAVVGGSPLFGILDEDVRREVVARMEWCYVPGGDVVFGPGDPSDALFLVVHGRLRIFWDLDASGSIDAHEAVDDVGEGGVVGDIG